MRKIATSNNNYLKSQTRQYISKAALSLLFFVLTFSLTCYLIVFHTQSLGILELSGFTASLIALVVFRFYQRKYHRYRGGRQGERAVINALSSSLNDDYYLVNGAYLKGGGGDVDHIVLGPSGIYVLETKNWSGKIICNGDQWQRPGKKVKGSPSLQVKHNTQRVKKLVNTSHAFWSPNIWIEGLLVFTNNNANLSISNPTVTILKLPQLTSYIKRQEHNRLTKEQVQKIVKQLQN
jgi:hypothetical protein